MKATHKTKDGTKWTVIGIKFDVTSNVILRSIADIVEYNSIEGSKIKITKSSVETHIRDKIHNRGMSYFDFWDGEDDHLEQAKPISTKLFPSFFEK